MASIASPSKGPQRVSAASPPVSSRLVAHAPTTPTRVLPTGGKSPVKPTRIFPTGKSPAKPAKPVAYAGSEQAEGSKLLLLGSGSWSAQCEVLRAAKHQLEGWQKSHEGRCGDADAATQALFQLPFKTTMECLLRALTSSVPRVSQSAVECLSLLLTCAISRATVDAQEEAVVAFLKRALSEPCMTSDNASSRLLTDAIHSLVHQQSLSVNLQLFALLVKKVLAASPLFTAAACLRFLQTIISLHPTEVLRQPELMSRLLEVVHFCVVDRSVSLLRVAKDVMCQCVQFDRAATAQALRGLQASKRAAVVEWLVSERVDGEIVRMVASASRLPTALSVSHLSPAAPSVSHLSPAAHSVSHLSPAAPSVSHLSPAQQASFLSAPPSHLSPTTQPASHAEAVASLRKSPARRSLSRPAMAPLSLNASLLSGVQSRIPLQTASQSTIQAASQSTSQAASQLSSQTASLLAETEAELDTTHEDIDEPTLSQSLPPTNGAADRTIPPEPATRARTSQDESSAEGEALLKSVASAPSTEVLNSSLVFRSA